MKPKATDRNLTRLVLTEELRTRLKRPLGRLLAGSEPKIYGKITRLISAKKSPRVVFVGDAVSRNAEAQNLRRDVMIIDNKCMRTRTKSFKTRTRRTFCVRNEAGTISVGAWAAVRDAIECGDALVIVAGEEDLLALVAVAEAPLGSFVIYGQPGKGVVLVEVDRRAKKRMCVFIESMAASDAQALAPSTSVS